MNIKYFSRKIGGFALATAFLTGIMFLSTTDARAQQRVYRRPVIIVQQSRPFYPYGWHRFGWYDYNWYNPYSQYVFDNSEKAAETGYKNGFDTGRDDGRKHKSYDPERSHYYHDAGFGNFAEIYRRNFKRGYQVGYEGGSEQAS
ncbi:MAG: hypothetical protein ACR2GD_01045 [Pyrinomonadaceae bacterium]